MSNTIDRAERIDGIVDDDAAITWSATTACELEPDTGVIRDGGAGSRSIVAGTTAALPAIMQTIPTIDLAALSLVIGGAAQPAQPPQQQPGVFQNLGQAAGQAAAGGIAGIAGIAGRFGAMLGGGQPAPSPQQGLSPIQSGMNGLAVRERLGKEF